MPWPMIHFAIEYKFSQRHPTPSFLLGNIAPDAVLVRGEDKIGKIKSHLGRAPSSDELIDFVVMNVQEHMHDENYYQFMFGYISHVFADLRWSEYKSEIANQNKSLRDQMWQEENQMDFNLYRDVTWREEIKENIMNAPLIELKEMYRTDELKRWRSSVFEWYEQTENEPNILNEYITKERVEKFIEETIEGLTDIQQSLTRQLEDGRNFS